MDVDWALAMVVFLFFISWAFIFTISVLQNQEEENIEHLRYMSKIIRDMLVIKTYEIPAMYEANESKEMVFYSTLLINESYKNSTFVKSNDKRLPCMILGNKLYWQSNVTSGKNYFFVYYAKATSKKFCNSTLSTTNATMLSLWAAKEKEMFHNSSINNFLLKDYDQLRDYEGITNNFMLEINIGNVSRVYGKRPPLATNVYVFNYYGKLYDSGEDVSLNIYMW